MDKVNIDISQVFEFRPIYNLNEGLRYNNGNWIPDDGEWDLAFVGRESGCTRLGGFPMVLYVEVPYYNNIIWRWAACGIWTADVDKHPNKNAWHYAVRDGARKEWGNSFPRETHANYIAERAAIEKCASLYSCANGAGPRFEINDKYIAAGMLRVRGTKEVVQFPDIFDCMYCGKMDWRKIEREMWKKILRRR